MNGERAITVAILAMGGEGGGVLAGWLVDLAERNGFLAQSTSVPGVAQRTGATIYYVEMLRAAAVPPGRQPVFALGPVPGEVDIVIASELMEAGRALQRGLVSATRTTFIASTHRVYSMDERTAMGDGRVDADKLLAGGAAAARQWIHADFGRLAEEAGSLISPALYGALAASGRLPFERALFEATIERGGVGVAASRRAFGLGFDAAKACLAGPTPGAAPGSAAAAAAAAAAPRLGPRLRAAAARIETLFAPADRAILGAAVLRLADYQDEAYAAAYLDRLQPLAAALAGVADATLATTLFDETARHLALWMSYEDTVRVADLKTRRTRFERVAAEVRLDPAQQLDIHEFLHPRVEEIADTLPASLGRALLRSRGLRALVERLTRRGRVVMTSSIRGYLLLYAVAALRPLRRRSLRYQVEMQRIDRWLATIVRLVGEQPALALEVARAQRLVKGYGDTHQRGFSNFERLMATLPALQSRADGGQQLKTLGDAALADDSGQALTRALAAL